MTCEPLLANSSVLPSGVDRATCSVPSTPPAPPLFSITSSLPGIRVCISAEINRASVSTGPPAANGTTTLIVSAAAVAVSATSSASKKPKCRIIGPSPIVVVGFERSANGGPSPALRGCTTLQHLGDAGAGAGRGFRRQGV